jgi:type IV pilus assembly protein PilY1
VKAWNLDSAKKPSTLAWTASIPAWGSRKVYTYNGSGTTFPTTAQVTSLTRTGGPVEYPVTGSNNANYIKGDQSKEGSNVGDLRIRTTILGDIVGSSPAYVADTDTLYVGANDGMLHAFDATNGQEQFAYVPGLVNVGELAKLSRGDYTHKFFVDGPIVVSDRKLTPGKNLLVGAMGKGGKGIYSLDVSSPAAFASTDVKWELPETAGSNMGYVLGRPILAKVKNGATAVLLGNGVNSTNNKAVLVVVNLTSGAVIREIDTGVGSASLPNGLSAPTAVVGPDGKTVAYAYAGDLQGNVWKFDMTSSSPSAWSATKLFTAVSDVTGLVQPITGSVTVALDPHTYKRWVLFGTGRFLTLADADEKTALAQSMYGFVDSDALVAMSDLQKRTIINTGSTQDGFPVRSFEAKAALPSAKKGWYVNLPADGERIVQDAQMVSNILVTASLIPTGDACEASGSGYINAVDAFTGTSAGKSFFDLDGDGDTSDTAIGGVPVGSVNFGVGMPTLPIFLDGRLIVGGTGGDNGGGEKPGNGGIVTKIWSRVSWREIKGD